MRLQHFSFTRRKILIHAAGDLVPGNVEAGNGYARNNKKRKLRNDRRSLERVELVSAGEGYHYETDVLLPPHKSNSQESTSFKQAALEAVSAKHRCKTDVSQPPHKRDMKTSGSPNWHHQRKCNTAGNEPNEILWPREVSYEHPTGQARRR